VAVASVDRLTFAYPDAPGPSLHAVTLEVEPGEVVLVLGPSGSGKSTLLRALGALVPHFHGGTFSGRVVVGGLDTRVARPAELAGTTAFVFQDPDEQIVREHVEREIAFGLENCGVAAAEIPRRVAGALDALGVAHLASRRVQELSGGELQRVCLASAVALEPQVLLLDEPTSQLDPHGADELLELVGGLARTGTAVFVSEQRPIRALPHADRVVFVDGGRVVCDARVDEAVTWLERNHRDYVVAPAEAAPPSEPGDVVCRLGDVAYAYGAVPAVDGVDLALRRGEIVALLGPNGSGKTTVAKLAAGLLEPQRGAVARRGRATLLLQDAGRHFVRDRALDEVALGVGGDHARARAALAEVGLTTARDRHPRDMSSGERERLALAAVLAPDPDLLVLDEPTKGADPERKRDLAAFLRESAPGRATLVVTHDVDFACAVADRRVELGAVRELTHA
jgi:energy-coupling factor transport system ATP-binding protein